MLLAVLDIEYRVIARGHRYLCSLKLRHQIVYVAVIGSAYRQMTEEEIQKTENIINEWISKDYQQKIVSGIVSGLINYLCDY